VVFCIDLSRWWLHSIDGGGGTFSVAGWDRREGSLEPDERLTKVWSLVWIEGGGGSLNLPMELATVFMEGQGERIEAQRQQSSNRVEGSRELRGGIASVN
jgi:hypothetical protein